MQDLSQGTTRHEDGGFPGSPAEGTGLFLGRVSFKLTLVY